MKINIIKFEIACIRTKLHYLPMSLLGSTDPRKMGCHLKHNLVIFLLEILVQIDFSKVTLNWFMPALAKRSVGSSKGIVELEWTYKCF